MIFATVLVLVAVTIFFAQRYKRCPPDKVMVIYGRTDKGLSLIHISEPTRPY